MSQPTPTEVLDAALECKPGVGAPIDFHDRLERERFRWRLYATMGTDARRSARLDDPASPDWGRHRWNAVVVERLGERSLWVGRGYEFVVGAAMSMPTRARAELLPEEKKHE